MKLIKGKNSFSTDDPTVIAAFKENGYVEATEPQTAEKKEPKKATKK
jgi:hypothetical protein